MQQAHQQQDASLAELRSVALQQQQALHAGDALAAQFSGAARDFEQRQTQMTRTIASNQQLCKLFCLFCFLFMMVFDFRVAGDTDI